MLELLQDLTKAGVVCLVFVPKQGPLLAELDRLNVEWRQLRYPPWISRRSSFPRRILRAIKGLVATTQIAFEMKRWSCDLVYTNTTAISVGAFAAWMLGKPHIWQSHESSYHNPKLKFDLGERFAARLMDRLSDRIIVVSRSLIEDYSRYINPERLCLIYQSVTPSDNFHECEINHNRHFFQCVIVGSLDPWKGQDEAISALSELIRRGVNAQLLIVGDGRNQYREKLQKKIETYGLDKVVKFTGYTPNPMRFVSTADVVLMCSHWETFGRITVEAMLAGKAVIGSANGGTTELIEDGKTGLLYQKGNHFELADKIQYLYENPEVKLALGKSARCWATGRFTKERYTKETLELLNEVLNESKSISY
ncbi:Glycosyltransferase involved in cell wall bisynthesis [Nitrosospira multiformis]|uniref:Glycosyltransferase involved in cell wall bisynthesis n=2 Tax=Nitrosospira multiformis TaxID=1231 RepID=A0A1I7J2A3_9PROT|nr:Glycosyltransferase involved in cell wall bisynthesis [Nitrosospira multiformis]